ncbi:dCTP deaminase [Chloroflexota bacterium]
MSIKPDGWIRRMALEQGMIEPFEPAQVRGKVISYGLSSYGYDIRLADEFKVLAADDGSFDTGPQARAQDRQDKSLDPKALGAETFGDIQAKVFELAAHTFVLGQTVEYFRIPTNVLTLCTGKSSYARCGVLVNVTPFEPGWEGYATLCIANVGPWPVRLYAGEGIAQVLFFESDEPCEVTYADKHGKYQAQQGITPARLG